MSTRIPSVEARLGYPSEAKPKPHRKHRKHRLTNFVQAQVYKLLFAHTGKFVVVALYFILTQWLHGQLVDFKALGRHVHFHLLNVKYTWDHAFSATMAKGGILPLMSQGAWTPMRHIVFRGLLEGVLGVVLYNQIGFNVEKYRAKLKPEPGRLDRLILRSRIIASPYQDRAVTGPQYAFLPVLIVLVTIIVGIPLYLGVHSGLAHAAHWTWLEPRVSPHQSFWRKLYVGEYDGLIIGIIVGVLVNRTYRAYLYANTMNYARSWVAKGRGPKWWMPGATRDLLYDLQEEGVERQREVLAERNSKAVRIAAIGVFVGLILAVYGFYIIKYIAH